MPDKDENNSDKALMALIDEHEPLLRSIIQLEVQNPVDADDVFQETVLAILEHFRAGKPVENPRAWMVKIAKNRCVDFHRQQRRDRIRDSDLAAFISSAAFGGGVSIADDQHQAVVVKEIRDVIAKMKTIYSDGVCKYFVRMALGYKSCELEGKVVSFRKRKDKETLKSQERIPDGYFISY